MKKPKAKKSALAKFNARDHWKDMPEFVSENKQPVKTIIVGFANKEDMLRFSKIIGQEVTAKTRSIWFPKVENVPMFDKRYADKK